VPDGKSGAKKGGKMNRYVTAAIAVIFLSLTLVLSAWAEPNVKEGNWEITSTTEIKGLGATPPQKVNQCISQKDVIPMAAKDDQCKVVTSNVSGDAVTWAIECRKPEGTIEGQGEIIYKGETFDGLIRWTVSQPGQDKAEMTQKIQGRRIGACE
jgi:hypothetical protein